MKPGASPVVGGTSVAVSGSVPGGNITVVTATVMLPPAPFGVVLFDAKAGEAISVTRGGVVPMTATAALTANDGVEVGANGRAAKLNEGARVGTAVQDAASGAAVFVALTGLSCAPALRESPIGEADRAPSVMYPASKPTVDGSRITVDRWLKFPTQITRTLADLTKEQFIAYKLFAELPGGVPSGSVIYTQQVSNILYANRNMLERSPGDEFPLVDVFEGEEHTASTKEFGEAFDVTDKAVKRNDFVAPVCCVACSTVPVDVGAIREACATSPDAPTTPLLALACTPIPVSHSCRSSIVSRSGAWKS